MAETFDRRPLRGQRKSGSTPWAADPSCFPFNCTGRTPARAPTKRIVSALQSHIPEHPEPGLPMSRIDQLTDRIERLLLRHEELHRVNALLTEQVTALTQERDSLRARLAAARARIDVLIDKLPQLGAGEHTPAETDEGAGKP